MEREQAKATERRDQVSITLDVELRERLERIARAEHRTLSGQVRHVLAQALKPPHEGVAV